MQTLYTIHNAHKRRTQTARAHASDKVAAEQRERRCRPWSYGHRCLVPTLCFRDAHILFRTKLLSFHALWMQPCLCNVYTSPIFSAAITTSANSPNSTFWSLIRACVRIISLRCVVVTIAPRAQRRRYTRKSYDGIVLNSIIQ